jgi:DNA-directed RNA polymerase beta subunit
MVTMSVKRAAVRGDRIAWKRTAPTPVPMVAMECGCSERRPRRPVQSIEREKMAQTFTGRKRVRKFFGTINEAAEMPNLIEVQKASYDQFLLVKEPLGGRPDEGLQAVFKSVFPISDFSNSSQLEFVKYEFEPPKYDVDECRQRGMTYAAPLKVTLRLIVFDIDESSMSRTSRSRMSTWATFRS